VAFSFEFGLWTWPFEGFTLWPSKSRAVGVHDQSFGLWAWPLEASHYAWPKASLIIFY
jgi:hypothetical protein